LKILRGKTHVGLARHMHTDGSGPQLTAEQLRATAGGCAAAERQAAHDGRLAPRFDSRPEEVGGAVKEHFHSMVHPPT
jgi:hypothetical protein